MLLLWEQSPGLLFFAKHILVAQIPPTAHIHLPPHLALYSTRFTFLKYFLLYGIIQNIFQRKKVIYIYIFIYQKSLKLYLDGYIKVCFESYKFQVFNFYLNSNLLQNYHSQCLCNGKEYCDADKHTTVCILGVLYNYHRITGWLGLQEEPLRSCSSNPLL